MSDSELAASLLAPFRLAQLEKNAMPHFLALLESHGFAWCRDLFLQWVDRPYHVDDERERKWLGFMPMFCEALRENGGMPGQELARWVVTHQWSQLEERCKPQLGDVANPRAVEELARLSKKLAHVLQSCVAADDDETTKNISRFLTSADNGYPVLCLVPLLRESRKSSTPARLWSPALRVLHEHCTAELRTKLAAPVRSEDDWSITPPQTCTCELCIKLGEFLSDGSRVRFEWPLAKDRRRHVHDRLDRYELPVMHTTRRQGRPYTLVLVKTNALFEGEAKLRQQYERELAWLTQERHMFAESV